MTIFRVAGTSSLFDLTARRGGLGFFGVALLKLHAIPSQIQAQDQGIILASDKVILAMDLQAGIIILSARKVKGQRDLGPVVKQIDLHAGVCAGVHPHQGVSTMSYGDDSSPGAYALIDV